MDAIELSGGTSLSGDLGPLRTRAGIPQDREAYYQDAALRLKQRVSVPVMLVGGIRTFEAAERLVTGGYADYVALSRPLVCEPGPGRALGARRPGRVHLPLRQPLLLQRPQARGHVLPARGARGPAPRRATGAP